MDNGDLWHFLRWVGFGIRLALLLLLLAGALITCASLVPSERTVAEFRAAVAAGEVDRVSYQAAGGGDPVAGPRELIRLEWSESPLIWHEVRREIVDDAYRGYTVDQLMADVNRAPIRASVVYDSEPDSGRNPFPDWPFKLPGGSNLAWLAAAWVVTFVVMLGSVPRLANRWAWFWMFTIGQVGAILFLILEPRPVWRGLGEVPVPERRVMGGNGCLISIGLSIVSMVLAGGVGQLVGVVLG
ncbi:hypothetical protein AB0M95_02335 [Sphaerisporangium sp. NPDC051017]|uniref:hypothetical protein n=1 Tax=Sphaerisporangium sp. NPDC051017 TaxID=3154636 RepID=UPI00342B5E3F